jgi:hypothetical protein
MDWVLAALANDGMKSKATSKVELIIPIISIRFIPNLFITSAPLKGSKCYGHNYI